MKVNKTYKSYDFTRDGKPDTFKYMIYRNNGNAYTRIYINGKYRQIIYMVRRESFDYVKIRTNNICIVATCGTLHGNSFQAYYYSKEKMNN